MVAKKKKGGGDEEKLARVQLKAILLADSFATKFRPITLECPKVLLPLVNVPMIDYTLTWLQSAEVEEVFVFCCAHSKQVIDYLENSKWLSQPNFIVTTIKSKNAFGPGDALRLIYERNVIHGDFILVSGDTVSNMPLSEAVKEHRDRRKKDSNAVMTIVIKQSKPSPETRQSRLGTDELFMAIDPRTKQLLYYEDETSDYEGFMSLDKAFLTNNPSIIVNNDKQDCYIDICSQEVLSIFNENFDYQHLRRHFKDLLSDNIMGYEIFTYEIHSNYAARIDNFRSYSTISKDIIQRWTYPVVTDVPFLGNSATKLERSGNYKASDIGQSRSAQIGPFTVIGNGTTIGDNSKISNSVVGECCTIGANVSIDGCYIWHNVTIEDGCQLKHAIVCDGVVLKSGSMLEPGVVLSFKVIIGQNFVVPAYSRVSLLQQPINVDSDEELEYSDSSSSITDKTSISDTPDRLSEDFKTEVPDSQLCTVSEVGSGGVGFIWSIPEGSLEEEWMHSVAPIPPKKLAEIIQRTSHELDINEDGSILPPLGELELGSISDASGDIEDFEKEVEATFLRAVHENNDEDTVITELITLRVLHELNSEDCVSPLFYSMMKLALDSPHSSSDELLSNASSVISKWRTLLKNHLCSKDEEIEVLLTFEEMCSESATREYSDIFVQILELLYEKEVIRKKAFLCWATEKEGADESDKFFLKKSKKFIQWLKEASEEEDGEDSSSEEDDED